MKPWMILAVPVLMLLIGSGTAARANGPVSDLGGNLECHGFMEARAGIRTGEDPHGRKMSLWDARLQVEASTFTNTLEFKFKADVLGDGILDHADFLPREAWVFTRSFLDMDVKIGRQVLTWGTGELVFLNDLFPKDWQSFFTGRDDAYLKAPSDAVKLSMFTDFAGVDLVYTPQFDPDHQVTGEYISHWDHALGAMAGKGRISGADRPDNWFQDQELALRIFRAMDHWELALYGYLGFWKTPCGRNGNQRPFYPDLNVYGASIRGRMCGGIGNLELAWYDSRQDRDGTDPNVENSQIRYLAGFNRDLAANLNAGLQYYAEQILDYDAHAVKGTKGADRDRIRHVITLQLTRLLMNQTLTLGLSAFWSPSDEDGYLKPKAAFQYSDTLVFEIGANLFWGGESHTFFGQFENNNNIYGAVRYHF